MITTAVVGRRSLEIQSFNQDGVNSLINSLLLSEILLCEKCLNGVNLPSLMKVPLFNLLTPTAPTVAMGAGWWLVCQQVTQISKKLGQGLDLSAENTQLTCMHASYI